MTENIVGIDFNGVKVLLDSNTKLLQMKGSSVNGTVTVTDATEGGKYQVPTGKKANIIFVTSITGTGGTDRFIFADDEDGTTNEVIILQTNQTNQIFISVDIPADKFLNVTDNSITAYDFHIIEQDA